MSLTRIFTAVMMVLLLIPGMLRAVESDVVTRNDLVMLEQSAMEMGAEKMTGTLSLIRANLRNADIPDCFELSDHIIRVTEGTSPEKQIIGADAAVAISPRYPPAAKALFLRVLQHRPYDFGLLFSSLFGYIDTLTDYVIYDSLVFSFMRYLHISALVFLLLLTLVLLTKYGPLLGHLLLHVTGYSRFYVMMFIVLYMGFVVVVVQADSMPVLLFIPLLFLLLPVMKPLENMVFAGGVLLLGVAGLFPLSVEGPPSQVPHDKLSVVLDSVYNPLLVDTDDIPGDHYLSNFARGAAAFYRGDTDETERYLSTAADNISVPEIRAAVENMRGAAFFRAGDQDNAVARFNNAFNIVRSPLIGYNLMRALNEKEDFEASRTLEDRMDFSSIPTGVTFPAIYLPPMKMVFSRLLSNGPDEHLRFNARADILISPAVTLLLFFLLYWFSLRRYSMRICQECGTIMCMDCSVSYDGTTCAACRMRKKTASRVSREEKDLAKVRVRGYYSRRRVYTVLFTLLFPGGGMIFGNRELTGLLIAFSATFMATPFMAAQTDILSFFTPFDASGLFIVMAVMSGMLYLAGIVMSVSTIQE